MRVKRDEGPAIGPRPGVAWPEAPERCPADCLCAGRLARAECNRRIDRLYDAVVERTPRETPATTVRPRMAARPAPAALTPERS